MLLLLIKTFINYKFALIFENTFFKLAVVICINLSLLMKVPFACPKKRFDSVFHHLLDLWYNMSNIAKLVSSQFVVKIIFLPTKKSMNA